MAGPPPQIISAEMSLGKGYTPALFFDFLSEGEIPTTRTTMGWRGKVPCSPGRQTVKTLVSLTQVMGGNTELNGYVEAHR